MKTPVLVSVVVMLHVAAVGTLVMVQGCGTTQPSVEPSAAPVMPPSPVPETIPTLKPPAPVHTATVTPPASIPEIGTYTVKSGDSIERIARRFKLSAREICELNNIKNVNRIREGQKLLIPGYTGGPEPKAEPKPRAKKPAPKAEPSAPLTAGGEYEVQPGDYLGKIASKHGVKIRDLKAINKLTSDKLRPGQKLVIPAGGSAAPAPEQPVAAPTPPPAPETVPVAPPVPPVEPAPGTGTITPPAAPVPPSLPPTGGTNTVQYPVVSGETVESIAKAFLVSPESIRSANNIAPGAQPAAGSMISIPIPE